MTYTYTTPDNTSIRLEREDGTSVLFGVNSGSPAWQEYVNSGETAEPYVAPPEPEPLTTEEKVNQLLSDYGLTREEMQAALAVKAE
mgnify:CR=1 FL=1